jgi:DMSO/TMAO reductase YedYZ molybdopterin-dependent catalytic subunit
MKKETQITEHSCIQGWTAIGEWAGVPLKYINSICKPLPQARYVVFYSYQYSNEEQFYETIHMELANHRHTILAYEMNGEPLSVPYGSPLRLRVETQLGFKMVKWIKSIEFVSDYKNIGKGQGGHREDHMYYGRGAGI